MEELFQTLLLDWFYKNARVLPWRVNPSLYKTVVSEFMLQQTQVKTVLPYFERWLRLFQSFEALAEAEESTVLEAWSGLGYYSRAKNLHELAKQLTATPVHSYADLLRHKGIGRYTAAAIASMCFNEAVAAVDGNVIRVLCRLLNVSEPFKTKEAAVQTITPVADRFLSKRYPGKYNEAIMELGALICTKQKPNCEDCPVRTCCQAFQHHSVALCPRFVQNERTRCLVQRFWLRDAHALLLEPSNVGKAFGNSKQSLMELPVLTEERLSILGIGAQIFTGTRSIGTKDFTEQIYLPRSQVELPKLLQLSAFKECRCIDVSRWNACACTGPHKRWIGELLKQETLFDAASLCE